jgi:hypothetical protein
MQHNRGVWIAVFYLLHVFHILSPIGCLNHTVVSMASIWHYYILNRYSNSKAVTTSSSNPPTGSYYTRSLSCNAPTRSPSLNASAKGTLKIFSVLKQARLVPVGVFWPALGLPMPTARCSLACHCIQLTVKNQAP